MLKTSSDPTLKPEDRRPPNPAKPASPGESIMEIIGISLIASLFNVPSVWMEPIRAAAGPTVFIPTFSAELLGYLPILNIFWTLALTVSCVRLFYGRRVAGILLAEILLLLFGMQIAADLLMGGPLFALEEGWVTAQEFSPAEISSWVNLLDLVNLVVKIGIGLAIFGSLVTLVRKAVDFVAAIRVQGE
jgi:hypothetical protein